MYFFQRKPHKAQLPLKNIRIEDNLGIAKLTGSIYYFTSPGFVDNFSVFIQAASRTFRFRKWYLCRLKPQEISPISKSSPSKPLLRALV